MSELESQLILPLIALIIGPFTSTILTGLRYVFAPIDQLNPTAKQALLIILSYAVLKLTEVLGLGSPLPGDPSTWTGDTINAILTALLSLGYYNVKKSVTAKSL